MQDYLIKKDDFKFSQILEKGYIFNKQPVVLNKSQKADGSIKVIYAQYETLEIDIKFGNLDGATIENYNNNFTDGTYTYWDSDTREYKQANFIVEKGKKTMLSSKNGEKYDNFDVVLTKSSEVA